LLVAGIDEPSSRRAIEMARASGLYAAVGVHPNESNGWGPARITVIEALARRPEVVAVGETGLDFYRDAAPLEAQHEAFRAHIALAKAVDKALIIHTRDSVDAALDELARVRPPARLVFHCWSGGEAQMRRALDLGAFISFAGNLTFKANSELRGLAEKVPIDRLLVETDSPYLAPLPHRGKPNEPAHVARVGECLAAVRRTAVAEIAAATTTNARALFAVSSE
jgi:TatD DNase family protein